MDCLSQIYTIAIRLEWQSGHAADCKSVYAGSIPTSASNVMKILVTGSAGFIGSHLSLALKKQVTKYSE